MPKELKTLKEITLSDIYGKEKYEKWCLRYEILPNIEVEYWLVECAKKYAVKQKKMKNFKATNYIGALEKYIIYWQNGTTASETIESLLNDDLKTRNSRLMEYLTVKMDEFGVERDTTVINNWQSRIKRFFSIHGKAFTVGIKSRNSGSKRKGFIIDRESFDAIITEVHSNDMKLILKLAGLNGLRISDIVFELTEKLKNGKAKYKIQYSKKNDCYYIEKFKTRKERVEIRYLVLHPENCQMLRICGKNDDLTKVDLSELFTKIENNELVAKYKSEHTLENTIRNRLRTIGIQLGYLTPTEKLDDNGNQMTKKINGNEVKISECDFTLGFHNFRKYFTSNLINLIVNVHPIPSYIRLHIEGHSQDSKITTTYAQSLQDLDFMIPYWTKAFSKIVCSTEIRDYTDSKTLELEKKQSELFEINRKLMDTIETLKDEMRGILDQTGTEYREYSENVPEALKLDNPKITISKKELQDLIASEVKKALKST